MPKNITSHNIWPHPGPSDDWYLDKDLWIFANLIKNLMFNTNIYDTFIETFMWLTNKIARLTNSKMGLNLKLYV